MEQVNIHDAKTRLSQLIALVEAGGEVVIARSGKPVARIVAYATAAPARQLGALRGKVKFRKGWDAPPTADELAEWENSKIYPPSYPPSRQRGRK